MIENAEEGRPLKDLIRDVSTNLQAIQEVLDGTFGIPAADGAEQAKAPPDSLEAGFQWMENSLRDDLSHMQGIRKRLLRLYHRAA